MKLLCRYSILEARRLLGAIEGRALYEEILIVLCISIVASLSGCAKYNPEDWDLDEVIEESRTIDNGKVKITRHIDDGDSSSIIEDELHYDEGLVWDKQRESIMKRRMNYPQHL